MDLALAVVAAVLLVFEIVLIARAVVDWGSVLAGQATPGSVRAKVTAFLWAVTEPVLGPVRRLLPPLRMGGVGLDLSFLVVFIAVLLLRQLVVSLY